MILKGEIELLLSEPNPCISSVKFHSLTIFNDSFECYPVETSSILRVYETVNRAPYTSSVGFKEIIVFMIMNMYLRGLSIYIPVAAFTCIYTHLLN